MPRHTDLLQLSDAALRVVAKTVNTSWVTTADNLLNCTDLELLNRPTKGKKNLNTDPSWIHF